MMTQQLMFSKIVISGVRTVTAGTAMAVPLFRPKTILNAFNIFGKCSWVLVLLFQHCCFEAYIVPCQKQLRACVSQSRTTYVLLPTPLVIIPQALVFQL